jgi:hypothetical protein
MMPSDGPGDRGQVLGHAAVLDSRDLGGEPRNHLAGLVEAGQRLDDSDADSMSLVPPDRYGFRIEGACQ